MRIRRSRGFTVIELAVVVAVMCVVVVVAFPAFMKFVKRGRQIEAAINLNRIAKNAKRVFAETGSFPAVNGAQLPNPSGTCCGGTGGGSAVNNKCAPMPDAFKADPGWAALGFSVDEPSQYTYSYRGDPAAPTVYAIGDPDCDGQLETWTLQLSKTSAGTPQATLTPPPNSGY